MLVDGDDMNEPIADAVRSILDGHVVLTRSLAHAGHYPAIDVLQSVSRLIGEICAPDVREAGQRLRGALAAMRDKEDLISIGAYQRGTDPLVDSALELRPRIDAFLRQAVDDPSTVSEADEQLLSLTAGLWQAQAAAAVVDEAPARAVAPPRVPVGGPAGTPSAIPSLQLTA